MPRGLRAPYREIQEELPNLVQLSAGLWADPERSDQITLESMTAVLMLNLNGPRLVEKLTSVLLARAQRESGEANGPHAGDPFYRLQPEERLLLIGLHRGRWSYDRLAKILEVTPEKIQELTWAARLQLVYSPESSQRLAGTGTGKDHDGKNVRPVPQGLIHPTGTLFTGLKCPEYHPGRPWTQRFLDEEASAQEKHFLERHLQECDSCRKALSRARTLYYAVERLLPAIPLESPDFMDRLDAMKVAVRKAVLFKHPGDRTLRESLAVFLTRAETQLALSALIVIALYRLVF